MNVNEHNLVNPNRTYDSYSTNNLRHKLWDSLQDRDSTFGFDYMTPMRVQRNIQKNHFHNGLAATNGCNSSCSASSAPNDAYFNLSNRNPSEQAIIGTTQMSPNLYDDVVTLDKPTIATPNLHRSWEPMSTTPTTPFKHCYTSFTPYENPVEVAPINRRGYWQADINSYIFERKMQLGAKESGYANHNKRQAMISLLTTNMPHRNDPYSKSITKPEDSYAYQLRTSKGRPPAVTSF